MTPQRKKELREQYRAMRPPMGVYQMRCIATGKCYIGATRNLDNVFNGLVFQLNLGGYPVKTLQRDWTLYGEKGFALSVLEPLAYDKDETKTNYAPDLEALRALCVQELTGNGTLCEELKHL